MSQTVGDLMTSPAVTASPHDTLESAALKMATARVGSVVVVEEGRATGILTERDVLRSAAQGVAPRAARVGDWMTADPDCAEPGLGLAAVWEGLTSHGYRHMPVVDHGSLEGVVSLRDLMGVAHLEEVRDPTQGAPGPTEAPPGLKGLVVAETSVGDVRGLEGFYHYRQYSATELAASRSLEDVWHLLFLGQLPDADELAHFDAAVRARREMPAGLAGVLPALARMTGGPLDGLRSAVSLLGAEEGFRPHLDITRSELFDQALRVVAVVPTIVAALHRLGHGLEPIAPNPDLGHAANYLYMVTGEIPQEALARAVEQYMLLTVDHGFNASTFTARVVTSTGADLAAAVVAAIGALSGPLHGGAPSRALDSIDAIGDPANTGAWVRAALSRGERIMGFGHAVYRTDDPRSRVLVGVAEALGGPLVDRARQVEAAVRETLQELKPGTPLPTNVEFYAGVVMELCGLPRQLFTPTFAVSRTIGWCAHVIEQADDNRIIRPSSRYVGPHAPQPVPPS
jgi:citrate synthase